MTPAWEKGLKICHHIKQTSNYLWLAFPFLPPFSGWMQLCQNSNNKNKIRQKHPHYFPASNTHKPYGPHTEVLILNQWHGTPFYLQEIKQMEKPFHVGGKYLFKTPTSEIITKEIQQRCKLFAGAIFFLFITFPRRKIHRGKDLKRRKVKIQSFYFKWWANSHGSVGYRNQDDTPSENVTRYILRFFFHFGSKGRTRFYEY